MKGQFGNDHALLGDLRIERGILRRIDNVYSARDDRDRTGVQRPTMGGVVDPARKTGGDHEPGLTEFARGVRGELDAERGRVPRAHDRYHLALQDIETPKHGNDRRWRIENGKSRRVLRFDGGDQPAARLAERVEFRPRIRFRWNT